MLVLFLLYFIFGFGKVWFIGECLEFGEIYFQFNGEESLYVLFCQLDFESEDVNV